MGEEYKKSAFSKLQSLIGTISTKQLTHDLGDIEPITRYTIGGECIVCIEANVFEKMIRHCRSDTQHEVGGALLGTYTEDADTRNRFVLIQRIVECKECSQSTVDISFPPEFWFRLDNIIENEAPDLIRLGTYHSHPGYGIFLSNTDRNTILNTFRLKHHIAIIIDPIKNHAGCFVWSADGNPISNGFLLYK